MSAVETVTIRCARPQDVAALARLAALDGSIAPAGPVLIAEVAGEPRAAISLHDGAVIANPFQPTAALVELLHARARQLRAASGWRGRARHALRRSRRLALG